jgi:hypothetical protein
MSAPVAPLQWVANSHPDSYSLGELKLLRLVKGVSGPPQHDGRYFMCLEPRRSRNHVIGYFDSMNQALIVAREYHEKKAEGWPDEWLLTYLEGAAPWQPEGGCPCRV